MIILFGANGVLGKEICEQLIGKDKKLILISFIMIVICGFNYLFAS